MSFEQIITVVRHNVLFKLGYGSYQMPVVMLNGDIGRRIILFDL